MLLFGVIESKLAQPRNLIGGIPMQIPNKRLPAVLFPLVAAALASASLD